MRLFLLFLMLLSETSVAQSDEHPVVRWALAPYAPFHIEDGPKAGQGVVDLALKGMMEALPEYLHVPLVMNAATSGTSSSIPVKGFCLLRGINRLQKYSFALLAMATWNTL